MHTFTYQKNITIVCKATLSAGGGLNVLPNFQKVVELDRTLILRGGLQEWEKG